MPLIPLYVQYQTHLGEAGVQGKSQQSSESYVFSAISSLAPIAISEVETPGELIYTTSTSFKDELWMYAYNSGVPDRQLTLQFGDTTTTNEITITIPGLTFLKPVLPGMILGNGLELRAFADEADAVTITGNVNQW